MVGTRTEGANVEIGNCIGCGDDYIPIGTEIDLNGEKFNVISQKDHIVTMLAQYNLGTDYKQTTEANHVSFSDTDGWETEPGPKEIDIQKWSTNPKTYVNAYVEYLKTKLGDNSVTGDLITLTELEGLGCSTPICSNSPYYSWLINGQHWWTCSARDEYVRFVSSKGRLDGDYYSGIRGVRPVITISKETLKNLG
jgi:hypothetical protein